MKTLLINRGGALQAMELDNGDLYDSEAELIDDKGTELWKSEVVNTDSTIGYKGGCLALGTYYGIVSYRHLKTGGRGKRVIKLFEYPCHRKLEEIKGDNLRHMELILRSDIPNPNHSNLYIITYVQIHEGGDLWDWSHGCLTIWNGEGDYSKLMGLLKDDEIITVTLFKASDKK